MKRGASGLSLVVGIDKPAGMSSHDVVNRCRSIFGERRVGHAGTLDPLASGVLPVCVGPATRLTSYLTSHEKHYLVRIVFGASTTTDDSEGTVTRTGSVPEEVVNPIFAQGFVDGLVGKHKQMPPVYSAIKVGGEKSCDAARKGHIINLAPRDIEVYHARLEGISGAQPGEQSTWDVSLQVSKGTYIRALARDVGIAVDCPAHVGALRRTQVGNLGLKECVSLSVLEELGTQAALDPVRLLGLRIAFLNEEQEALLSNGSAFNSSTLQLFEQRDLSSDAELCSCTTGTRESYEPLQDREMISMVARNRLVGLYFYDMEQSLFRPQCVFQTGVIRGGDL